MISTGTGVITVSYNGTANGIPQFGTANKLVLRRT